MMLPSVSKMLALLVMSCMVLEKGFGHPLSGQQDPPAQTAQLHRVRTKRCSCNSWLDKECIYFCHLDIIWVNTPSKILPYGLGSPLSRRRRSADRCKCAARADTGCFDFCRNSSEKPETDSTLKPLAILGILTDTGDINCDNCKLLTSLRSVVRSNTAIARRKGLSNSLKSRSGK